MLSVKLDEDQKARHTQGASKRSGKVCKRPGSSTRSAYVYTVLVDGVVRYVGKGRNGRMYSHLIEAKRSAARCAPDTSGLYPRIHRKLVEAVRAGSHVTESAIVSGLTDKAAYRLESRIIGEFHKHRAGQLWNTIDERFMDPRSLPEEWDDPEHPLYKLPRPFVRSSIPAGRASGALAASAWVRRGRLSAPRRALISVEQVRRGASARLVRKIDRVPRRGR
jgi:hypothetical protein